VENWQGSVVKKIRSAKKNNSNNCGDITCINAGVKKTIAVEETG
jgi:hypothetical protein